MELGNTDYQCEGKKRKRFNFANNKKTHFHRDNESCAQFVSTVAMSSDTDTTQEKWLSYLFLFSIGINSPPIKGRN